MIPRRLNLAIDEGVEVPAHLREEEGGRRGGFRDLLQVTTPRGGRWRAVPAGLRVLVGRNGECARVEGTFMASSPVPSASQPEE